MTLLRFKNSYYNIFYNISGKDYVINTINCAMAEIDDNFKKICNNPNSADIESDDSLVELRNAMKDNGFIVNEDISELNLLIFEHFKTQYSREELSLTISPTMGCNFACPYCFENKDGSVMSDAVAEALLKFIKNSLNGTKKIHVVWFGGEPLLAQKRIWELSEKIIEIATNYNIEYSAYMISNTYLADNDVAKKMKQYKIEGIQTTIDGLADFHNKRRFLKTDINKDTFSTILKNVKTLVENGIKVNIRINVDKTNVNQAELLIDYLASHGFNDVKISIGQILPITDTCSNITDDCLSTEEFSEWTNKFYGILRKNGFEVYDKYPFYPVPRCNYCSSDHINSFYVLPNGNICKCWDEIDTDIVGNVFDGIGTTLETEYSLSKWMNSSFLEDEECMGCKYLPICMGGCPHLRKKNGIRSCEKWKWGLEGAVANIIDG